jgi:hypothetical protein
MQRRFWLAALCALFVMSTAAAFQQEGGPKKDVDLPPEIAKLPFEIRDGYRRFLKRCIACHDTKRVQDAKKSLFEWQGVIGTMSQKKDANIPIEDRHPIFLYLSYLNGVQGNAREKDEYLTFLVKCEDCHGISLVYKDKKPLKDWPNIVHRMAGKNQAKISDEDEKKVMAYINRMYPDVFGVE